jgi:thioredoxin-like negative regulator of GroEL
VKRLLAGLTLATLLAPAVVGQGSPNLPGLRGDSLGEAELRRGDTVIVIWASWSPRCRDVGQRLTALEGALSGTRVVSISYQEERDAAATFVRDNGVPGSVYLDRDGAFARRHGVSTLPSYVVFRDGAAVAQGRLSDRSLSEIGGALRR